MGRWIREHLVLILGLLVLAYTFVPIAVVVLMSFNDPASRNVYRFDAFTLDNWTDPCAAEGMCAALGSYVGHRFFGHSVLFAAIGGGIGGYFMRLAIEYVAQRYYRTSA